MILLISKYLKRIKKHDRSNNISRTAIDNRNFVCNQVSFNWAPSLEILTWKELELNCSKCVMIYQILTQDS